MCSLSLQIRDGHGSLFQNPTQNFWTQPNPSSTLDMAYQVIPKTLYNNCYTSQTSSQFVARMKVRGVPHSAHTSVVQQTPLRLQTAVTSHRLQYSIQLQYSLTDSRVFHDVKNITQSSLQSPPNPTQPMDGPNP